MGQQEIPKAVHDAARRQGFNYVEYAGQIDGANYYSVGVIDSNGDFVPIGLPTFIALKNGRVSWVSGEEGLGLSF